MQDNQVYADTVISGMFAGVGAPVSGAAPALAANGTIQTNVDSQRVTAAAAVAGLILTPGVKPFQEFTLIHEGAAANTLTFAAAGTSNVADGVSDVITGPSARKFKWNAVTSLWYKVN